MATFRERESGWWQAIVRRKGHPEQSKTFEKKADAEAWALQVEAAMGRGGFVSAAAAERTIFKDLAKDFETDFAPHHYRGQAWKHKLSHLVDQLGSYSLVAITPQVVAGYRDRRLTEPDPRYKDSKKAPRISPATVKTEIDLLSKVFDVAGKEFGIALPAGNPAKQIRKPKAGKGRDRRLTTEEWTKLMAECRASRNRWLVPAVTLAVETAMRQGELLSVEWKHVDRKRKLLMLLDPEKIKTEEPRAVPLSSTSLAVLDALPHPIKGGRVIPQPRMTLYKAFENAVARADIKDYTWHDLRHEALSRLAERGDFTVLELAAVSGHKTLQMLKRYTHLQAQNLAEKLG